MNEWIIICNPKEYNIEAAFKDLSEIDWRQSTNIKPDDIVFIYVGKPFQAIKYKCLVKTVDLPYGNTDDSKFIIDSDLSNNYGRYMRLILIDSYNNPALRYNNLILHGLHSVRGPSKVSIELHNYIENSLMINENIIFPSSREGEILQEKIIHFDPIVHNGETNLLELVNQFVSDYSIQNIQKLSIEEYVYGAGSKKSFCYRVANELIEWGSIRNGTPNKYGIYFDPKTERICVVKRFGNADTADSIQAAFQNLKFYICDLIAAGGREDYDSIISNPLSIMFKNKLLCIYYPDKYINIYSIDHIQFFMDVLNIPYNSSDNYLNWLKQIIIWKNNNSITSRWTNHEFSNFLYQEIGYPPDIIKQINNLERNLDIKLNEDVNDTPSDELPSETKYNPIPVAKKEPIINGESYSYPRDRMVALSALKRANYKCEINDKHSGFIRKSNGTNYTEPHHLIPLSMQNRFENSLDVEANIVSLCSNCHNQLHYGKDPDLLLETLYNLRKDELDSAGIHITLDRLKQLYR